MSIGFYQTNLPANLRLRKGRGSRGTPAVTASTSYETIFEVVDARLNEIVAYGGFPHATTRPMVVRDAVPGNSQRGL